MNKTQKLTKRLIDKGYSVDNVTWVPIGANDGVGIDGWTVEFVGAGPSGLHGFLGLNFEQALKCIDDLPPKA